MEIPVGFAQVNLVFTGANLPFGAESTFGVDVSAYAGDAADAAADVAAAWASATMGTLYSSSQTMSGVKVKFGPASTGASAEVAASTAGTQPTAVPPNTAWLLQKGTAFGGRAGRGRMYIPGLPEEQVDQAGIVGSTYRAASQLKVDDFFAKVAVEGLTPVLLHGAGSPLTVPSEITSVTIAARVATQRKRMRR